MIITDISAQHILKYASLELHDLPENGVIAIDGPNESGKSSIGETICFALFGRTFSLPADELEKLIRWGEGHCSAQLRFYTGDGNHYEIARFLDRDGNQGARLNLVGEEEKPMARGVEAVENAIYSLLGYGYDEFIESFYLAQREITTPHPHSYAVKTMAGLSTLEYVNYEYAEEIEQEQEKLAATKQQLEEVTQALQSLALDPELLPSLQAERDRKQAAEADLQQRVEKLETASNEYQNSLPLIRSLSAAQRRNRFFRLLSLLLSLAFLGSWGLLTRMSGSSYAETLNGLLAGWIPQWGSGYVSWLLYAGIAFVVIFILFWLRIAALNGRLQQQLVSARQLSEQLSDLHKNPPPAADVPAAQAAESSEEGGGSAEASGNDAAELPPRPDFNRVMMLSARIAEAGADAAEVRDAVSAELSWMRDEMQRYREMTGALEQQIQLEAARVAEANELTLEQESLEQKRLQHEQRIRRRELAQELLAGCVRELSHRFNQDLRALVGRTLPLFTEGRYQHLQIDGDLTVRVFSNEKRDFMDLEEISSGTQRQIMLAVRLALAQKLVNNTVEGKQFLFLDEPFAFFDQERTRSAISVLPGFSDELTQIWIVAQEFPLEQTFDVPIACTRDSDQLPAILGESAVAQSSASVEEG